MSKKAAVIPETKLYYFLVAGTVFFQPQGVEDIGTLNTNAIITTSNGLLPTSALADAQRGLVQALTDRIGTENPINVVDVQVLNICKLGHMYPSEFHNVNPAVPAEGVEEDYAPATVQ